MNQQLDSAALYTRLDGLAELRRQSTRDPQAALAGVARQFEALFMQMVLKSMRDANLGSGLFDSDQSRLYQELYDKQLSTQLSSEGNGFGIAEMLVRQLQGALPTKVNTAPIFKNPWPTSPVVPPAPPVDFGTAKSTAGAEPDDFGTAKSTAEAEPEDFGTAKSTTEVEPEDFGTPKSVAKTEPDAPAEPVFDSPRAFIQALWPHAQRAAAALGVAPEALLAQAALETGWGKAVIRHPDGNSSHNLFNIKADRRWDGERVAKPTLEYRDGIARQERASFRAYDSYAASFDDYVKFLTANPRYRSALAQSADPKAFLRALQQAGYATDPAYADKITDIMGRGIFAGAVASIKNSGAQTLTG